MCTCKLPRQSVNYSRHVIYYMMERNWHNDGFIPIYTKWTCVMWRWNTKINYLHSVIINLKWGMNLMYTVSTRCIISACLFFSANMSDERRSRAFTVEPSRATSLASILPQELNDSLTMDRSSRTDSKRLSNHSPQVTATDAHPAEDVFSQNIALPEKYLTGILRKGGWNMQKTSEIFVNANRNL